MEEHFEVASLLGGPRLHVGNQVGRGFLHAPRENDAGKIGDVAPFLQILAAVRGKEGEQCVFHEVDRRNRRDASRALKVRADRLHGKACGRDQAIGAPASSQERIVYEGHHMRVLMRVDTEIATLVGEGLEIALDLLAEFAGKLLANAVTVAGAQCRAIRYPIKEWEKVPRSFTSSGTSSGLETGCPSTILRCRPSFIFPASTKGRTSSAHR